MFDFLEKSLRSVYNDVMRLFKKYPALKYAIIFVVAWAVLRWISVAMGSDERRGSDLTPSEWREIQLEDKVNQDYLDQEVNPYLESDLGKFEEIKEYGVKKENGVIYILSGNIPDDYQKYIFSDFPGGQFRFRGSSFVSSVDDVKGLRDKLTSSYWEEVIKHYIATKDIEFTPQNILNPHNYKNLFAPPENDVFFEKLSITDLNKIIIGFYDCYFLSVGGKKSVSSAYLKWLFDYWGASADISFADFEKARFFVTGDYSVTANSDTRRLISYLSDSKQLKINWNPFTNWNAFGGHDYNLNYKSLDWNAFKNLDDYFDCPYHTFS